MYYRPFRPGDEDAIANLFERCFDRPMPAGFWRWRFLDNPAGQGLVELAWDGQRLVGHYAVTCVPMKIGERVHPTGLSGTTMTDPDYRGQGLFTRLAMRVYDRMAEENWAVVWGFPNMNSHVGFVRDLGWLDVAEVPVLRAKVSRVSSPKGAPFANQDVSQLNNVENLLVDWMSDQTNAVERSPEYLKWRYLDNPAEEYRMVLVPSLKRPQGLVVYKKYMQEFQIMELIEKPGSGCAPWLVMVVVDRARQQGCESVGMWLGLYQRCHLPIERMGFVSDAPVTYFGVKPTLNVGVERENLAYNKWWVSMGDSDVY